MSRLTNLSRALTGGTPVRSPFVVRPVVPPSVPLPASTLPVTQPIVLLHRNQPRWLTAPGPDGTTLTQSVSRWAAELELPAATLRWRVRAGWSDAEVLGVVPHPRDRQQEQAAAARAASNVIIVDEDGSPVGRPEAARRLGIKKASLVYRLRRYRAGDGSQAQVSFALLQERGRKHSPN